MKITVFYAEDFHEHHQEIELPETMTVSELKNIIKAKSLRKWDKIFRNVESEAKEFKENEMYLLTMPLKNQRFKAVDKLRKLFPLK